ncbi:MAG: hypothetical protein AAGA60_03705 [Cyanobacteria bacterium P01_E01_bin.42]
MMYQQLEKAKLINLSSGKDIEFMFNPSELKFDVVMETVESSGAKTQKTGRSKVNYSHRKATKVTISNVLFDTYEEGINVVDKYISSLEKALEFVQNGEEQRPPTYRFNWGTQTYLRYCFVENLSYTLTMFLPNGTPVRAKIDSLTLKETDEPKPSGGMKAKRPKKPSRETDQSLAFWKEKSKFGQIVKTIRNVKDEIM